MVLAYRMSTMLARADRRIDQVPGVESLTDDSAPFLARVMTWPALGHPGGVER